jgi:hypothetical protein
MLAVDHTDLSQSTQVAGDWDSGARKASCPDGQRLVGLSHTGNRGLCTDRGGVQASGAEVVRDERHVSADWARGYTKFECAPGSLLIGYSVRGANLSSVLCGAAGARTTAGRTVWFDRGDNRPANAKGGDFAAGHLKGQCAEDEYAAGVAWTNRFGRPFKRPDALLCRPL